MDIRKFFGLSNRSLLFASAGVGRETNDALNKSRETVLCSLYTSVDPMLALLQTKWKACLTTICSMPYTSVLVNQTGGRGMNYDFTISFLNNDTLVHSVNAEFKHNADRIDALPEYFSPAADKPYFPRLYADTFYECLDAICDVYPGLVKPDRETYLRLVHNNDYNRHPFFQSLYEMEKTGTREQYAQKRSIVRESIRMYLDTYGSTLDCERLSADIRRRQKGKVFLLWNLREFKVDQLAEDEMEITHIEGIKHGNTIVAVSRAGTKHNMLLRWKNHLGILYPAWQISLTRLANSTPIPSSTMPHSQETIE